MDNATHADRETRGLVLGFFVSATCISLFINNTSVALMLLPIGWAMVDRTQASGLLPECEVVPMTGLEQSTP